MNDVSAALKAIEDGPSLPQAVNNTCGELVMERNDRIRKLKQEREAMGVQIANLEADKQITGQWLEQNAKTITGLEADRDQWKYDSDGWKKRHNKSMAKVMELEADNRGGLYLQGLEEQILKQAARIIELEAKVDSPELLKARVDRIRELEADKTSLIDQVCEVEGTLTNADVRIRELEAKVDSPELLKARVDRITKLEANNIHIADNAGKAYVKISELEAKLQLIKDLAGEA